MKPVIQVTPIVETVTKKLNLALLYQNSQFHLFRLKPIPQRPPIMWAIPLILQVWS